MKSKTTKEIKRLNIAVPKGLYDMLETTSQERHATITETLKRYIKLGVMVDKVDQTPGAALLIREGMTEREIVPL